MVPGNLRLYVRVIIRNIMAISISLFVRHLKTNFTFIYINSMKKFFGLLIIGMSSYAGSRPGFRRKGFDKSKLFFGGNLGLAFGNYTIINVSPLVGYRFTEFLLQVLVSIIPIMDTMTDIKYSKQTYVGMSLFGRVYPIRTVFYPGSARIKLYVGNVILRIRQIRDIPTFKI